MKSSHIGRSTMLDPLHEDRLHWLLEAQAFPGIGRFLILNRERYIKIFFLI
jgi:hypothetical protein